LAEKKNLNKNHKSKLPSLNFSFLFFVEFSSRRGAASLNRKIFLKPLTSAKEIGSNLKSKNSQIWDADMKIF